MALSLPFATAVLSSSSLVRASTERKKRTLRGGLLQVRDEVLPVLLLLEAGEDHLGAWDVLLGGLEVVKEGVLAPGDAGALVGLRILEAGDLR